jgi:capsular exopolysaccharide synthesis family protein
MAQNPGPRHRSVDLRRFLGVVRARRWTVLLVTVLVTASVTSLAARRAPLYTATARVEVRPLASPLSSSPDVDDVRGSMATEAQRVTSEPVVTQAAEGIGTEAATTARVTTDVPADTTFLDISCTDPSPAAAQACANSFALGYINDRRRTGREEYASIAEPLQDQVRRANRRLDILYRQLERADGAQRDAVLGRLSSLRSDRDATQLQLLAIPVPSARPALLAAPAGLPVRASNGGLVATGAWALVLGLAVGIGLAFVRERFDDRVADRARLEEALGAPVLALVPRVPGRRGRDHSRVVTITEPDGAASEAYRAARTRLLRLTGEGDKQVIAITSADRGDGKTVTTVNLAVALAQSGKRVIAVSADLRDPRLHRAFHLQDVSGLAGVLIGATDVVPALCRTEIGNLLVLPSGPELSDPGALLASPGMDELLEELRHFADVVLLDTPAASVAPDVLVLAPKVDDVIVVADAAGSRRADVTRLRDRLEQAGGRVLGGILYDVDPVAAYGTHRGNGYDDSDHEEPSPSGRNSVASNGPRRTTRRADLREARTVR